MFEEEIVVRLRTLPRGNISPFWPLFCVTMAYLSVLFMFFLTFHPSSPQSITHHSAPPPTLNDFVGFKARPSTPETHFKYLGTTAVSTEFAHLTFTFDLHHMFQNSE